ncbi:multidrug resistance-associated ABC transporter [Mycena amicta]|nr:multidrug resistance-associated ABC transporter [Mycena amicta]
MKGRYKPDDALYAASAGLSLVALVTSTYFAAQPSIQIQGTGDAFDPFDIARDEDLRDGTPVNEAAFWRTIRLRKLLIIASLLGVIACQWFTLSMPLLFAVYLVVLVVAVPSHSASTVHLSMLTLVASLAEGAVLLLPTTHTTALSISITVLYLVCAIIALTTPMGPPLHYQRGKDSSLEANFHRNVWLFMFATKVLSLSKFEIEELPIVKASMRATKNYTDARRRPTGSQTRLQLLYHLIKINVSAVSVVLALSFVISFAYYAPPFFLKQLIEYLEADPNRSDTSWAWFWVSGFFLAHLVLSLGRVLKTRFQLQLNALLFAKTLVRKDTTSSAPTTTEDNDSVNNSKAGIIALMSSDVDQVGALADSIYDIADTPFEILVGVIFLYQLLGNSCLVGLAVTLVCLPLHQRSGGIVADAQRRLFQARDERVALTNEMLGAIRMLKFMAWERNFEARLLTIREKELAYQKLSFTIEVRWTRFSGLNSVPIIFALVSFSHFTVIAGETLTPAIAFTAVFFTELQFSIKGIPASVIRLIQGFVSLGRISDYLSGSEVAPVLPLTHQTRRIAFECASVTWPQATLGTPPATPQKRFTMLDLNLVCGRFGSGKTLLLLALLGEADVISGTVVSPRSPPNSLAHSSSHIKEGAEWVVDGLCAYVPQTAWLRNQSIKDNILFNLPYDEQRYRNTIYSCALEADLRVLDDGDVSLARAVYSRASTLLLDDILSAVDSHTAQHIYTHCLKGPLLKGRTVIVVSHHVQLCAPGAAYVVALDHGRVHFQGSAAAFNTSGIYGSLVQTLQAEEVQSPSSAVHVEASVAAIGANVQNSASLTQKKPRKFVTEEERAIGNVDAAIWKSYFNAWGGRIQWVALVLVLLVAACSPLLENGWLKVWASSATAETKSVHGPLFYVGIYAALTFAGLGVKTLRWYILYSGSIKASRELFQGLLHSVLLANIRFHDTISRGRLLNRFGRDLEGIDKRVSTTIGHCVIAFISAWITFAVISVVGGPIFCLATVVLGLVSFRCEPTYMFSTASREMRRLSSVSSSPLHSLYWETVSGITTLRAFGGSTQFVLDMLKLLDANTAPAYWTLATSQWLSFRSNALTTALVGLVAVMAVLFARIDASLAGFTVMFAQNMTNDAHRFSGLEQDMVALERIKEFSEIEPEEPVGAGVHPPKGWPRQGEIRVENLVVRYASDLPPVLHGLNFEISPGEKIGIIGRTGSGKSTLALSLFRFVPQSLTTGRILIDGVDIASIGLHDLRRGLTIIPQDPTILSGTIRSTLDPEGDHSDADIFGALRRVHLIQSSQSQDPDSLFSNLDSPVSEGGENFSAGEKQLLCLGRAILKQSRVLIMDETADKSDALAPSVDFSTDELITQTVRDAFARSTVLTIAHRLSTIVAYDRVMVLQEGRVTEFDRPRTLLSDPGSAFYAMCSAMGNEELAMLKRLAG